MKYFVTGATGFIGSRLVRGLVERGDEVTALVRDPGRAEDLKGPGVTLVRGDITDRASLRTPMEGADGVFHLAAWYKIGVKDRGAAEKINVEGTRNVLETMRDLGIRKGVYTSTLAVFSDTRGKLVDETYRFEGRHLSVYDRTKWRAHYEVALPMIREGLPLVIVQPGVVYGPGDHSEVGKALELYLKKKLPLIPTRTAFSWAHVDDVAEGHLLAMDKGRPGESYILAGPAHTMAEALGTAEALTGIRASRLHAPPWLMRANSMLVKPLEWVLPLPPAYTSEGLRVAAGTTYIGDNAKARRELGYHPRPLKEGLRETLAAMMERMGISEGEGRT
jgi:nucleoside-diphosphate-sugar epimerase